MQNISRNNFSSARQHQYQQNIFLMWPYIIYVAETHTSTNYPGAKGVLLFGMDEEWRKCVPKEKE